MNSLELKVPPPVVALLVAGAMWIISRFTPLLAIPPFVLGTAAIAIALAGASFMVAAVMTFRRAGTTVNPKKPAETSALVSSGIYRASRNPMYAGLLLALIAWTVFLSAPWSLVGPLAFVVYINRFQIVPEERMLLAKFGEAYAFYKSKARRWL